MTKYEYKEQDFENPSALWVLEDTLKGLIGGPLLCNRYFKTFGLKGNEKVLDFGCGGGADSRSLAKFLNAGGHLTCVDISNYWIEKARRRLAKYPHVECRVGDIRKLKIPDQSFDVIFISYVIHDIPPEERQDTIILLCRELKADGTIFVREPVKKSHGMPLSEIRTLFSNAGLIETECHESKSEYRGRFKPALTSS